MTPLIRPVRSWCAKINFFFRAQVKAEESFDILEEKVWDWEPDLSETYPLKLQVDVAGQPKQEAGDLLLVAQLLEKEIKNVSLMNETEMRRVFGLVFDVLRCQ